MRKTTILAAALILAVTSAAAATAPPTEKIPANPKELKFEPLKFDVPKPDRYAFKLSNGVRVWIAEDHSLPLVKVGVTVRAGEFLVPAEQMGLAALTGTMMRKGGAGDRTAEQFDERVDFLAAQIGSWAGSTQAGANLDCLSSQLESGLDLLFDMLRRPRFQQDRIDVEKAQALEGMKQRNDDAGRILSREWGWLLYGSDHYAFREQTKASLDRFSRDDLAAFHARWWRPDGMILTVSGDVTPATVLKNLEQRFEGWSAKGPKPTWPPPPPGHALRPGLYHVEKDIPQGKVAIGHLGIRWDPQWKNADAFPLIVMNDILGGGGFTSRITQRIRSDEGLAYSAGSSFGIGVYWPGIFRVSFQTKNATVAYASKIALNEIRRIQDEAVTEEELTTSKNSFVETFPRNFESPADIVSLYAGDDYVGRPHSYWDTYRERIGRVTAADVQRVAKRYLSPDSTVLLVVGKWAEIEPGDPGGKATMKEFHGGRVVHLPLRDPLTLVPMR